MVHGIDRIPYYAVTISQRITKSAEFCYTAKPAFLLSFYVSDIYSVVRKLSNVTHIAPINLRGRDYIALKVLMVMNYNNQTLCMWTNPTDIAI